MGPPSQNNSQQPRGDEYLGPSNVEDGFNLVSLLVRHLPALIGQLESSGWRGDPATPGTTSQDGVDSDVVHRGGHSAKSDCWLMPPRSVAQTRWSDGSTFRSKQGQLELA